MPVPPRASKVLRQDPGRTWPTRIVTWAAQAKDWLGGAGRDAGPMAAWTVHLSTAERVHAEFFIYR